jgi:GT2 family glycosyltransferase
MAELYPKHILPHFASSNIGTTRSRNRLFSSAKGDFLCVMDSDVELLEGVIDTLIPLLEKYSDIGILAPRINYPNGKWQKSFDRFPTILDKINRLFRLKTLEKNESDRFLESTQSIYIDYAISAFWLLKRDLLETVGFLDERIFYSPEDLDYCLRVWKTGYKIVYVPSVSVVHHAQEISRGFTLNSAKFSHIKGLFYYFLKHRYFLRRPQVFNGVRQLQI